MKNNEWLLENLQVKSTVFHIGKYCGSWQGSTAGQGKSSYHIVMEGDCWLHLGEDTPPALLHTGDVVFILRDCPFILSAHRERVVAQRAPVTKMQVLSHHDASGTALTCGFLTFHSVISQMILSFLPEVIILKNQDDHSGSIKKITDVIHQEAHRGVLSSERVISSLAEILLFIGIRQYLQQTTLDTPLDNIKMAPEFLNLFAEIILFPAKEWSVVNMAAAVGMSRSWFIQRFNSLSAIPPAEMVCQLRISLARQQIENGKSLQQAAELVGYQSQAAFNRAFQRVTGLTPGRYRQQYLQHDDDVIAS